MLLITGSIVAATAALTNLSPRQYFASTNLLLTFQSSGPFEQLGVPTQLASSYLTTQIDIITSHKVARKVVDTLGLAEIPDLRAMIIPDPESVRELQELGALDDHLAELLAQTVSVQFSRESRVLSLGFISTDAKFSALIADTFAQAYIDVTLELSMEPARRNAEWFDGQIKILQGRLEEKQRRLTEYQQDKGIVAIDEKLDTETLKLEELSSQLLDAQAAAVDVRSRRLGVQHPEYIRAVEREQSLQRALTIQKDRVLKIKKERDELDVLVRDVASTRLTYDTALQGFYQNTLESQFNQTNIAILNRAVVPTEPASPNVMLNIALSIIMGAFFAIAVTILSEVFDRRIRTSLDLTERLGVPVLISL